MPFAHPVDGSRLAQYYRPLPKRPEFWDFDGRLPRDYRYTYPHFSFENVHRALEPYLLPVADFNKDDVCFARAVADVIKLLEKFLPSADYRFGVIGFESAMLELRMLAMAGYPFSCTCANKWDAFERYFPDIYEKWLAHFQHIGVPVWMIIAKLEPISVKKYNNGQLRTIMAACVDFLLYCISLFKEQNDWLVSTNLFAVGYSVEFGGFHRFAQALSNYEYFLEVDGKNFDRRISAQVMDAIKYIRQRFHSDPQGVSYAYSHIRDSVFLTGDGEIYTKFHGNPSGSYNTIIDNCLATLLYEAYVVERLGWDYEIFKKETSSRILGDDYLLASNSKHYIAFEEWRRFCAELGQQYELALQSEDLDGHSFFGKFFRRSPYGWYGEPNWDKIVCHIQHIKQKPESWADVLKSEYSVCWPLPEARKKLEELVQYLNENYLSGIVLPSDEYMFLYHYGLFKPVVGGFKSS